MLSDLGRLSAPAGQLQRADVANRELARIGASAGIPQLPLAIDLQPAYYAVLPRATPDAAWPLVEQALARHPMGPISPANRPYGAIAEIAAMTGRAGDVHALRMEWEAGTPVGQRDPLDVIFWNGLEALGVGTWDRAADDFSQLQAASHCLPCGAYLWAYALDRGGRSDSARRCTRELFHRR